VKEEDVPRSARAKCGACKADIIWTTTEAANDMPVDLLPGGYTVEVTGKAGKITRTVPANIGLTVVGNVVMSRVVKAQLAFGNPNLHLAHWVRCPHSKMYRRRPTATPRKGRQ